MLKCDAHMRQKPKPKKQRDTHKNCDGSVTIKTDQKNKEKKHKLKRREAQRRKKQPTKTNSKKTQPNTNNAKKNPKNRIASNKTRPQFEPHRGRRSILMAYTNPTYPPCTTPLSLYSNCCEPNPRRDQLTQKYTKRAD